MNSKIDQVKIDSDSALARVLVIEDIPMIQFVTKRLLQDAGFSVDIAGSGEEAVEKFLPEKYSLIYMDIGLPKMDGYEAAKAIRDKEATLNPIKKVPIIALTAHSAVDIQAPCSEAGMQGVLSKPLSREQANAIWQYFGKGKNIKVPGLILLSASSTPAQSTVEKSEKILPVIDLAATVELMGSAVHANELFALLAKELTENHLPEIDKTVTQQDYIELRKHLHSLIGALCYVKVPRLNHALLRLQQAARHASPAIITAYQQVKAEVEQFLTHYQQMQK